MINRREFVETVAVVSAGAALWGCGAKKPSPNVIFIMADDLGYGDLGCYGQKLVKTPNIDQLSVEGMRFTDCYAGSPVCAPCRSVLMTGRHTGHTTVRGNFGKGGVRGLGGKEGRVPLRADDVTVAEIMKKAGYVTGMTGKWGLGEPGTTGEPNSKGFDEWFGYLNQRRAHTYYPDFIWKDRDKYELPGNIDGKKEQYTHDMFTDFALDFIERHSAVPFFLYVPYMIPHSALEVPSLEPYENEPWEKNEKAFAAMVTRMDRDVGRIMALLKKLEIDNNTYVFFCSDNGAAMRWEGMFDSSGPLRGQKRDVYEGGIRCPMIVRHPGVVPAGAVSNEPWYLADVMPTLAEMTGVPAPPMIDGISVLPTLKGEKQNLKDRFLYWEFHERGFQQAVRWRDWKAVRMEPGKPLELYDLANDIAEVNDIAEKHPDVIETIEQYLAIARTESADWPIELESDPEI